MTLKLGLVTALKISAVAMDSIAENGVTEAIRSGMIFTKLVRNTTNLPEWSESCKACHRWRRVQEAS